MKILAKIKKCSILQLDLKLMQKQPPKGVLRKSVLKIPSKFTGEHPCRSVILPKMPKQLYITLRHGVLL